MYISETGDVKASIAVLSIPLPLFCIFQRLVMLKLVLLCCLYHYLCFVKYISETGDVKASIAVLSIPLPLFCIFQRLVMLKLILLCCLYHYLYYVYFRD